MTKKFDKTRKPESGRKAFSFSGIGPEKPVEEDSLDERIKEIVQQTLADLFAGGGTIGGVFDPTSIWRAIYFLQGVAARTHRRITTINIGTGGGILNLEEGDGIDIIEFEGVYTILAEIDGNTLSLGAGGLKGNYTAGNGLQLSTAQFAAKLDGTTLAVSASGLKGNYTAGDGLDLSTAAFSVDLKTGGGLKITSTELEVDPTDFLTIC